MVLLVLSGDATLSSFPFSAAASFGLLAASALVLSPFQVSADGFASPPWEDGGELPNLNDGPADSRNCFSSSEGGVALGTRNSHDGHTNVRAATHVLELRNDEGEDDNADERAVAP
jgi:hypothetical protein